MDFRSYCKKLKVKKVQEHADILIDICALLKNCSNCQECKLETMVDLLELCDIGNGSFRMPGWTDDVNRDLFQIANNKHYIFSIVNVEDGNIFTEFKKREVNKI